MYLDPDPQNLMNGIWIRLVELCFSLHIIPLDPNPDLRAQINADPTGSSSLILIVETTPEAKKNNELVT